MPLAMLAGSRLYGWTPPGALDPDFLVASPFDLEVMNIKPAGTGDPAIPASNRIFHAYPGIEYNIRAAVRGGTYPYTFALSGQPAGMTINANTGEISWPDPDEDTGTITLTVTDSASDQVTADWEIGVHTSGFWFVDGDYGGTSTGTITQPFKTLLELVENTQGNTGDIVYLLEATNPYTVEEYPASGEPGYDAAFHLYAQANSFARAPHTILGYPGGRPIIDLESLNNIRCDRPYFYNVEIRDALNWAFTAQAGTSSYTTLREVFFNGITCNSGVNNNQGLFFSLNDGDGYYFVCQDCEQTGFVGAEGIGSLYSMHEHLIEGLYSHDGGQAGLHAFTTPIGIKVTNFNSTVRGCRIFLPDGVTAFGMYNAGAGDGAHDFCFNKVISATNQLALEWFAPQNVKCYRNTFVGNLLFNPYNAGDPTHTSAGPHDFRYNIRQGTMTNATYVTESDSLTGAFGAGFVDANGDLQGEYTQYVGQYGAQLG